MDKALQEFLDALRTADDGKTCFVVEGKNDVAALVAQGIRNAWEIDTQLYLFAEKVADHYCRVVILTDLDEEGNNLHSRLQEYFSRLGLIIVEEPREQLRQTTLRHVEGLRRHLLRQSL